MSKKKSTELLISAPWGKIAVVTWGSPTLEPVLMVHGYMDSAGTFLPLLDLLPDTYYYVAVDMPGHGRSDPLPIGLPPSQTYNVHAMKVVVDHMQWKTFIYITHSVGFIAGVIYNYVYPGQMTRMVNLDPQPPISTNCFHEHNPSLWYHYTYEKFFESYSKWDHERSKQYTHEQAINILVRSRKLTEEQAAIVLSRIMLPLNNGMYKLSWEPSMKNVMGVPISEETLVHIVSTQPPPMLNLIASVDNTLPMFKGHGVRIMEKLKLVVPNFIVKTVEGAHDVHITNPERFVKDVAEFLETDFKVRAKL